MRTVNAIKRLEELEKMGLGRPEHHRLQMTAVQEIIFARNWPSLCLYLCSSLILFDNHWRPVLDWTEKAYEAATI